eukprot:178030-Chlamydomonas_euryale.AAC.16
MFRKEERAMSGDEARAAQLSPKRARDQCFKRRWHVPMQRNLCAPKLAGSTSTTRLCSYILGDRSNGGREVEYMHA